MLYISQHARTSSAVMHLSAKAVRPVDKWFCVDIDLLKSSFALGFIPNVACYYDLSDILIRLYLESEATDSKNFLTLLGLDPNVKRNLHMYMKNPNASMRMRSLFDDYQALLQDHELAWLLGQNPKEAVQHALSAIKPAKLRSRLKSDTPISRRERERDSTNVFKQALPLSEAFRLVDSSFLKDDDGSPKRPSKDIKVHRLLRFLDHNNKEKKLKKEPVCLWPPHQVRGEASP